MVNAIPTAFWMTYHVSSDPQILHNVRVELSGVLNTRIDADGAIRRELDLTKIKDTCPLLDSIFQETLLHRSIGSSTRNVLENTVVGDQYLLKKGAIVQIPSLVVHADPAIWGSTVKNFDHRRFLKRDTREGKGSNIILAYSAHLGDERTYVPAVTPPSMKSCMSWPCL